MAEQLAQKYTGLANRTLPSVQGRFLAEAVDVLAEAYGRLMPETPTEPDDRGYSRCLERVAERAMVPGSLIAYLVLERARKG